MVNNYGLSETTVVATSGVSQPTAKECRRSGAPCRRRGRGGRRESRAGPAGGDGDFVIGGVAVGRGYLNRPDLTAERFLAPPAAGTGPVTGCVATEGASNSSDDSTTS